MMQTKSIYLLILVTFLCFAHPSIVFSAQTIESKVIPITSNTYIKSKTTPEKAVKKNDSTKQSSNSSNTVANNKNTSSSNNTNKTTSNSKTANTKTTPTIQTKTTEISKNKTTNQASSTTNSAKNTKIEAKNPIKITQNLKEEKTPKKNRIPEPEMRVRLGTNNYTSVTVILEDGGQINNSKGKRIKKLKKGESFTWTSVIDKKSKKKQKIEYLDETLEFIPTHNIFAFNNTRYRGKLLLKLTKNGAIPINEVGIEDYLRGVVGREIGSSSPNESLKAQTVIARTYAYANKNRHGSDNADICNTTHCQVYAGISGEHDSVNKAIKETKGYILTYNGNPISALYHATCGGKTSNNEEVWGGSSQPFLRRVQCDFCEEGTKYRWNHNISISELREALAKEKVKLDEVFDVSIESPSHMDRVTNLVFKTKQGEQKIKGTTIRRIFNLPSTTFVIDTRKDKKSLIATEKEEPQKEKIVFKPIQYQNIPGVFLTTFTETQHSPKQLLVYSSGGLVRAKIPKDGWRCISYTPTNNTDSLLSAENKNTKKTNTTTLKTTPTKRALKPINSFSIFGRGYGHQVGLCQSGAIGMGKKNWNYRQILAHYYQGVALRNLGY